MGKLGLLGWMWGPQSHIPQKKSTRYHAILVYGVVNYPLTPQHVACKLDEDEREAMRSIWINACVTLWLLVITHPFLLLCHPLATHLLTYIFFFFLRSQEARDSICAFSKKAVPTFKMCLSRYMWLHRTRFRPPKRNPDASG